MDGQFCYINGRKINYYFKIWSVPGAYTGLMVFLFSYWNMVQIIIVLVLLIFGI